MLPFLKGFLGNLSAVQSKQILHLLSQMRDRGEIRSAKDFEKKLVDLVNLIQKDQLTQRTPLLNFIEGEVLESDAIRTFTEYLRLDLEAALGETESLSNSITAHNRILAENYFDALEAAIIDLEAETRAYEILENQKYTGFKTVLKQLTFDGAISVPGADESDPFVSSLFIDNRGGEKLFYASPDRNGGGLRLAINVATEEHHYFDRVEVLTDSTTPQTALNTSMEDNSPLNAIDGNRDTFWKHTVLLTDNKKSFVRLRFSPSFVGARRVNGLVIDPISDVSMKIVSISYINSGGKEIELPIGTSYSGLSNSLISRSSPLGEQLLQPDYWILPNTKRFIPVGDIIARRFTITLQQDTGSNGDFFYYDENLGSWARGTGIEGILGFRQNNNWNFDGKEIAVELGFIDNEDNHLSGMFADYSFGFREVSAISHEYKPNGLFVPEPFVVKNALTTLALYTDLLYPPNEFIDTEFLLRKENYDSTGVQLDVETIPFLPFGTQSINERLFFSQFYNSSTQINDTGALRFYPDFNESFEVFQNGITTLTLGIDYEISVDGGVTFETSIPPLGIPNNPKKCLVKVKNSKSGSIYSVSYSPLVSTSDIGGEVWLNADRTVRLGRYQTYIFNNERPTGIVDSCKIGLQIIIRANTLNNRVSSYLKEVVFLGG